MPYKNYQVIRHSRKALLRWSLGNKCAMCGSTSRLQFHHKDPETKEFEIGPNLQISMDRLIAEARKCVLLCHECHVEYHAERAVPVKVAPEGWYEEGEEYAF